MRNIRDSLSKIAAGMAPIIDTEARAGGFERGLARWKPAGVRQR